MDERIKKLAKVLVHHSCRVQKGEKVYLNYVGADKATSVRAYFTGSLQRMVPRRERQNIERNQYN